MTTTAGGLQQKAGPLLWALCFQYFVAEIISAKGYAGPYSLSGNYISDLGAVHCVARLCSPRHAVMNSAFVLQGVLIFAGAILVRRLFRKDAWTSIGFLLLEVSGLGLTVVGLAPEDSFAAMHYLAATTHFVCAGLGMLVVGICLLRRSTTPGVGCVTAAAGAVTLGATMFLAMHIFAGLGVGGMERVAAYPFTVWLVGMGIWLWLDRQRPLAASV